MKKLIVALVAASALVLTGCLTAPSPLQGMLYLGVKDVKTVGSIQGAKTGTACVTSVLGMVATGDSGLKAAQQAGGIQQVEAVDYTSDQIWFFWAKYCTVVYGK